MITVQQGDKKFLQIESQEEFNLYKNRLEEHSEALLRWLSENKTNAIPVEESKKLPHAEHINNDVRSALEQWIFTRENPKEYFLYINEERSEATTWTDQYLGKVSFGKSWRSNLGDIRVPISVYVGGGVSYYGTYYKSSGDYARIKKYK